MRRFLTAKTPVGERPGLFAVLITVIFTQIGAFGAEDKMLLRQDLANFFQPHNLAISVVGLGVVGIAHNWDDELGGEVGGSGVVREVLDLGNQYGSSAISLATTAGMWGMAKLVGFSRGEAVFSDLTRAILLANVVVTPIKLLAQRERPDSSNNFSFPSGHSANAFAMTSVLARRYGLKLAAPLIAFTAVVPVARIDHNRHFFSDVVAGSILGLMAGSAVTLQSASDPTGISIEPRLNRASLGMAVSYHF